MPAFYAELSITGILALGAVTPASLTAYAVGEGPNYGGNESIQTTGKR